MLIGIALRLQRIGHHDNVYYTAAVKSMTDNFRVIDSSPKRQNDIVNYIRHNWIDVSFNAGLNPQTLFINPY